MPSLPRRKDKLLGKYNPKSIISETRAPGGGWKRIDANAMLNLDTPADARCIGCHGLVLPHKGGRGGAYFRHHQAHIGCAFSRYFDKDQRPHPNPVAD